MQAVLSADATIQAGGCACLCVIIRGRAGAARWLMEQELPGACVHVLRLVRYTASVSFCYCDSARLCGKCMHSLLQMPGLFRIATATACTSLGNAVDVSDEFGGDWNPTPRGNAESRCLQYVESQWMMLVFPPLFSAEYLLEALKTASDYQCRCV